MELLINEQLSAREREREGEKERERERERQLTEVDRLVRKEDQQRKLWKMCRDALTMGDKSQHKQSIIGCRIKFA